MASKKELEVQNKQLKDKLFAALDKIKIFETKKEEAGECSELGFGILKEGNHYKIVKLAFDPESGEAKVSSVEPIDRLDNDYSVALMRAKEFLVKEIFSKFDVR